jgi:hypothetical protein
MSRWLSVLPLLLAPVVARAQDPAPAAPAATPAAAADDDRDKQGPPIGDPGDAGGLVGTAFDFNGDGIVEVRTFASGSQVKRQEVDLDRDGRVDVVTEFDGSGAIQTEFMDGDFDGKFDWVDHYAGGQRTSSDADVDYDGRVDVIYHYSGGQLVSRERFGGKS